MIHITEKKLVAAIQIALVGECENTDRTESKLLHDIKALCIADSSNRSKTKVEVGIWKTPYTTFIDKEIIEDLQGKHPDIDKVSVHFNTEFILDALAPNESVCWGDGKHYCFILTKLKDHE